MDNSGAPLFAGERGERGATRGRVPACFSLLPGLEFEFGGSCSLSVLVGVPSSLGVALVVAVASCGSDCCSLAERGRSALPFHRC